MKTKAARFLPLDAAGTVQVDTEVPWFLNMLNCPKAWTITQGEGVTALISDQGFRVKHPELAETRTCHLPGYKS